jgi:putative FmdB family regulatory protein
MPVYEYKCLSCHRTYDILHKGKELIEDIVCPDCNSGKYAKLMSVPSVSTKGMTNDGPGCSPGTCCGGGSCGID